MDHERGLKYVIPVLPGHILKKDSEQLKKRFKAVNVTIDCDFSWKTTLSS
jgi:hypothetical protein